MKQPTERSLNVIVMDVSPVTWGERELIRKTQDKSRLAAGKRSIGPARLEELLSAVQCFVAACSSLEKDAVPLLIGVAGTEVAMVYPRKDALEEYFRNPENKLDSRHLPSDLLNGVAELMAKASAKQQHQQQTPQADTNNTAQSPPPLTSNLAAMASAFSVALCLINRFMVAVNAGVSALHDHHSWNRGNRDDDGVIAALGGGGGKGNLSSSLKSRGWSPRILLLQASDDRPSDYNAMMNCAFASVKQHIVVDACYILSPSERASKSSSYLEQTCDMTGGLLSMPSAASQADKALTEVLLTIFLPPRTSRHRLNQVTITNLDFRARSFDTGEIVDMAYVCNQCLSIFSKLPVERCPTCDAEIRSNKKIKS